jgi:hypothetical protein
LDNKTDLIFKKVAKRWPRINHYFWVLWGFCGAGNFAAKIKNVVEWIKN